MSERRLLKGARQEVITPDVDAGVRPIWGQPLTDQEFVFVQAYLETMKVGEAAVAAGWHFARGSQVIRRLHVRQAIDGALAERFNVTKATIAGVLANMALRSPKSILAWGKPDRKGRVRLTVKQSRELSDADWDLISGMKSNADGSIEVKLVDRMAALEKLAKLLGVMRELPEAEEGASGVLFIVGDPALVLERHRANRVVDLSGDDVQDATPSKGAHTDLAIAEPK